MRRRTGRTVAAKSGVKKPIRKSDAGLACPKCGAATVVLYTRHRPAATKRVRRCRTCGWRIRTREIIESYRS